MNCQIEKIIQAVCEEYDVTACDILGRSRETPISDARMIAVYLAYRKCDMTILQIAREFNRNHPTIIYSIHRIEDLLEFDKPTKLHYERIREKL